MESSNSRAALSIPLTYFLIAGFWVVVADILFDELFVGTHLPTELNIAADLLVCMSSAILLYILLQRERAQRLQAIEIARRAEGLEARVQERTAELAKANRSLEQRVQERTTELSTLLQISHDVSSTLELEPLMDTILDRLSLVVAYTGASLVIQRDERAVFVAYRGPQPPSSVLGLSVPLGEVPIIKEALERLEPIIIPDLEDDSRLSRNYKERAGRRIKRTIGGSRSLMAVPLLVKDRKIGVLRLDHLKPQHFTNHDADLALAMANEAAIAIENARLYEDAHKLAGLEERQRLARELHDSVAQSIYGIALGAHAAREMAAQNPSETAASLNYIISLAQAANVEMRSIILELRPEYLEKEGLRAALERQVAATKARYCLDVEADLCPEPLIPLPQKEALYRIAQEALYNTGRHAKASKASIRLSQGSGGIELDLTDDGIGFNPSQSFSGHLGLKSMRERMTRLGGTLQIESLPGHGTHIRAILPA